MHVAVLSTGNALLESALVAAGHHVTAITPAATPNEIAQSHLTVEHWDDLPALVRLAGHLTAVEAVATIDEQCVVAAAYLRQMRDLPGLTLEAAHAYTDKPTMKTILAKAGLPVAAHRVVHHARDIPQAAQNLGWPVLVKPRSSAAAWNTFTVGSPAHLEQLLQEGAFDARVPDVTGRFAAGHALDALHEAAHGFVVEQFLDVVAEYFCDLYLHRGEVLLTVPGFYDRPLLQTAGHASIDTVVAPTHPEAPAVVELASRATAALGEQTGVVHAELLRAADGVLYIGEAAARPGGAAITELAARMYEFDLPQVLAGLATDGRPAVPTAARYHALSAVMIDAPPGVVTSVADRRTIEQLPGVLDADIRLTPGAPTPPNLGTYTAAGRVLYVPYDLGQLDEEAAKLRSALAIQVSPAHP